MPQEHSIRPELLGYWLPALSEAAASGKTPGGWSVMVISYPPRVRFAELYWLRDKAVFWKTNTNKLIITITKITSGKVPFVRRSHRQTTVPALWSRTDVINETQSSPSPTSRAFGTSPRLTLEGGKKKTNKPRTKKVISPFSPFKVSVCVFHCFPRFPPVLLPALPP